MCDSEAYSAVGWGSSFQSFRCYEPCDGGGSCIHPITWAANDTCNGSPLTLSGSGASAVRPTCAIAPFAASPTEFTELGRLRVQECERVAALRTELTKCGAKVSEEGDTLTVWPSALHGAEIETYNDHRIAMSFAVLGLRAPGMRIRNPGCVGKSFPGFWDEFEKLYQTI